jgi:hypothetical protein
MVHGVVNGKRSNAIIAIGVTQMSLVCQVEWLVGSRGLEFIRVLSSIPYSYSFFKYTWFFYVR